MELVKAFNGMDDVVLADEPMGSLAASDKVGLDAKWSGARGDPLLYIGRREKVINALEGCGSNHEHG